MRLLHCKAKILHGGDTLISYNTTVVDMDSDIIIMYAYRSHTTLSHIRKAYQNRLINNPEIVERMYDACIKYKKLYAIARTDGSRLFVYDDHDAFRNALSKV